MASNTVIQTNVLALNAHRNLGAVGAMKEKASQRLSSGFRINSAADDAAGLAVSEKMRAQIRGLDMASKNTQDAVSLVQTAEGGMQEINSMIQRVRELVVQASNDTNEHNELGTGDRQKIQDEIDQLAKEIDDMAGRVEFNKKRVIDGSYMNVGDELSKTQAKIASYGDTSKATTIIGKSYVDNLSTIDYSKVTTNKAIDDDAVKAAIDGGSTTLNALLSDINDALTAGGISVDETNALQNVAKGLNLIKADVMGLETQQTRATALGQMPDNEGLYFQIGANANQGIKVSIGSIKTDSLGIGDGKGNTTIDVLHASGDEITAQLDTLDNALSYVSTERSRLGAVQNRLEHANNSLQISSENLSAAESRIRDTDMAKEMMSLSKANVLQQAAVSMLAQANQQPQSVLQLLQ